jgi:hypothetical protein
MFKPVRVIATILVLSMIVMIFVSAFVLNSGTLSISKRRPVIFHLPLLGAQAESLQSSSFSNTSHSSGTHCRTFPTHARLFSRCSAWHNLNSSMLVAIVVFTTVWTAPVIGGGLVMLSRVYSILMDLQVDAVISCFFTLRSIYDASRISVSE